jgi:hypothetical protein
MSKQAFVLSKGNLAKQSSEPDVAETEMMVGATGAAVGGAFTLTGGAVGALDGAFVGDLVGAGVVSDVGTVSKKDPNGEIN